MDYQLLLICCCLCCCLRSNVAAYDPILLQLLCWYVHNLITLDIDVYVSLAFLRSMIDLTYFSNLFIFHQTHWLIRFCYVLLQFSCSLSRCCPFLVHLFAWNYYIPPVTFSNCHAWWDWRSRITWNYPYQCFFYGWFIFQAIFVPLMLTII